ncbi:WD40-repeat-containing domain protein [Mycena sp. CBHHK59/15]|nr:WD40-repeat-containing domain protein [Mycena sp. CBHHK59/15]
MSPYFLDKRLTANRKAGAVNCLLFFNQGRMLASGGDDQCLRIWELRTGTCQQELQVEQWGQLTNISMFQESAESLVIFIGTGKGIVSAYPWSQRTERFNPSGGVLVQVFEETDPVEMQAIDPINALFAVGSHTGHLKMYAIKSRTTLEPLWRIEIHDIPRSIMFLGDNNERLTYDLSAPKISGTVRRLDGAVGSVALSPSGRTKAIYNLTSCKLDVYKPLDSLFPTPLSIHSRNRKIKGVTFTASGGFLVCGGDEGSVHVFDAVAKLHVQTLSHSHSDDNTIHAIATCSTDFYHLIASGDGTHPAAIYVWASPTARKEEEDRQDVAEAAARDAEAAELAQKQAEADEAARALKEERDAKAAEIERLRNELEEHHYRLYWAGMVVVTLLLLHMFCGDVLDFSLLFLKNLLSGAVPR